MDFNNGERICIFRFGFVIGLCVCLFLSMLLTDDLSPSIPIDITTNVTSVDITDHNNPIIITEVGEFVYHEKNPVKNTDYLTVKFIPENEPLILNIENGYVRSYIRTIKK